MVRRWYRRLPLPRGQQRAEATFETAAARSFGKAIGNSAMRGAVEIRNGTDHMSKGGFRQKKLNQEGLRSALRRQREGTPQGLLPKVADGNSPNRFR